MAKNKITYSDAPVYNLTQFLAISLARPKIIGFDRVKKTLEMLKSDEFFMKNVESGNHFGKSLDEDAEFWDGLKEQVEGRVDKEGNMLEEAVQ